MVQIDKNEIKIAASGRWPELLETLGGIPRRSLDGREGPCPKCGGKNRFRLIDAKAGAVFCNQCFKERNGDGIAALQWATGETFPEVLQRLAGHLGLNGTHNGNGHPKIDPLELLARKKRCPKESLRKYGGTAENGKVVFPVFGPDGAQCSEFTITPSSDGKPGKGLFAKGKKAGVFLPLDGDKPRLPKPGEQWHLVEGCKDAAALDGLGLLALGMNTCHLNAKFAGLLNGADVVLIPDRDKGGTDGAQLTAARLYRLAASVRIAVLPAEYQESEGKDVRDILALEGGEGLLRQAIEQAPLWTPTAPNMEADENGVRPICCAEGCTDAMNARRFHVRFGQDVRNCEPWNKWLVWDGTRWKLDDTRAIDARAKEIGQELWKEKELLSLQFDPEENKAILKAMSAWCQRTSSEHALRSTLALARSEPGIPVLPGELDGNPWLLNVVNGTLDLGTDGTLRPHDRADKITKLAPVQFDPNADCPQWVEFLKVVLPDADLRAFVRRLVGYCLTGSTQEHVLPFLYGVGANGKSTFLNTVLALLGTDYAMKAPTDLLLAKRNESHPTELADLFGKRFVACIEAEDGRRLAESLVKELTGGDRVRARRMREDFWEFQATHKIWLGANHKPQVRGTDHGIWRRIKLIPFTVTIPDAMQDKSLPDKLLDELPGILNWALFGCQEWQRHGLGEPTAVRAATAEYRSEMDVLGEFLADCCELADHHQAGATELFEAYKAWADQAGERPITQRRFGQQLTERGFASDRFTAGTNKGRKCWGGVGLLPDMGGG